MPKEIRELIETSRKSRGLSKSALVEKAGYKNINKGLRKLDELMEEGVGAPQLEKHLPGILGFSQDEFENACMETQVRLQNKAEEEERKRFRPVIVLRIHNPKIPIFIAALTRMHEIPVPAEWQELPFDEEIKAVVHAYFERCEMLKAKHLGAGIRGFRYHRRYDESLDFDAEGELLSYDHTHIPADSKTLSVAGKRIPPFDIME